MNSNMSKKQPKIKAARTVTGATRLGINDNPLNEDWENLNAKNNSLLQYDPQPFNLIFSVLRNETRTVYSLRNNTQYSTILCKTYSYYKSFLPIKVRAYNVLPYKTKCS